MNSPTRHDPTHAILVRCAGPGCTAKAEAPACKPTDPADTSPSFDYPEGWAELGNLTAPGYTDAFNIWGFCPKHKKT
jgi:hypothetical protein